MLNYNVLDMSKKELIEIIEHNFNMCDPNLTMQAHETSLKYYGNNVYLRGLIELTNYCKNNCYYCGLQAKNKNVKRYRLSKEDVLECCRIGYSLGFHTFVLQGGEDDFFNDDELTKIVSDIREKYPDCAITLSLGERSKTSYKQLFEAGANRYLLRHETANKEHYSKLHSPNLTLDNRKKCLYDLKEIGFQVGAGFMVGSPFQKTEHLAEDLLFLKELEPHMVGIGPFIPQKDSIFAKEKKGGLNETLTMVSLARLMLPKALIPSTTALGTIDPKGRALGLKAGANVVMPNLSPIDVRKNYQLYDGKIFTNEEAAEGLKNLEKQIISAGFKVSFARGDWAEM